MWLATGVKSSAVRASVAFRGPGFGTGIGPPAIAVWGPGVGPPPAVAWRTRSAAVPLICGEEEWCLNCHQTRSSASIYLCDYLCLCPPCTCHHLCNALCGHLCSDPGARKTPIISLSRYWFTYSWTWSVFRASSPLHHNPCSIEISPMFPSQSILWEHIHDIHPYKTQILHIHKFNMYINP